LTLKLFLFQHLYFYTEKKAFDLSFVWCERSNCDNYWQQKTTPENGNRNCTVDEALVSENCLYAWTHLDSESSTSGWLGLSCMARVSRRTYYICESAQKISKFQISSTDRICSNCSILLKHSPMISRKIAKISNCMWACVFSQLVNLNSDNWKWVCRKDLRTAKNWLGNWLISKSLWYRWLNRCSNVRIKWEGIFDRLPFTSHPRLVIQAIGRRK